MFVSYATGYVELTEHFLPAAYLLRKLIQELLYPQLKFNGGLAKLELKLST